MQHIKQAINNIKRKNPVILNITNFVTMDFIANCLLSIGAAPIMSIYHDEIEELIHLSSAIYINIGTLDKYFIKKINKIITLSQQYNKPIVLDPVGCGATKIRTEITRKLAPYCKIIRGNASEIMALGNSSFSTKGVESIHKTEEAVKIAENIANQYKSTIIISGAIDYITDGLTTKKVNFGSPVMAKITGMGCCLTAVIAAILAADYKPFEAGIIGTEYFSLCGSLVAKKYKTPGSFKTAFIDALYAADFHSIQGFYDEI